MKLSSLRFPLLIFSSKAAAIAEQLPKTSAIGPICYYDNNDRQEAKTAAALANAPITLIINTDGLLGVAIGVILAIGIIQTDWWVNFTAQDRQDSVEFKISRN